MRSEAEAGLPGPSVARCGGCQDPEACHRADGCASIAADRAAGPLCHCGGPVAFGFDGDPAHHRGMCERCDAVRCDAYPGACRTRVDRCSSAECGHPLLWDGDQA